MSVNLFTRGLYLAPSFFQGAGISGNRTLPEGVSLVPCPLQGLWVYLVPGPFWGVWVHMFRAGGYVQGVATHPLLLIPSGSHHTYSQQVGSTYPTGMFSCFFLPCFTWHIISLIVHNFHNSSLKTFPSPASKAYIQFFP